MVAEPRDSSGGGAGTGRRGMASYRLDHRPSPLRSRRHDRTRLRALPGSGPPVRCPATGAPHRAAVRRRPAGQTAAAGRRAVRRPAATLRPAAVLRRPGAPPAGRAAGLLRPAAHLPARVATGAGVAEAVAPGGAGVPGRLAAADPAPAV